MSWFLDDIQGHEGYVVGLIEDGASTGRFRELRYPADDFRSRVSKVQVACECGWRSTRLTAPLRAEWVPFSIVLNDDAADDTAHALWVEHMSNVTAADALTSAWRKQHP